MAALLDGHGMAANPCRAAGAFNEVERLRPSATAFGTAEAKRYANRPQSANPELTMLPLQREGLEFSRASDTRTESAGRHRVFRQVFRAPLMSNWHFNSDRMRGF